MSRSVQAEPSVRVIPLAMRLFFIILVLCAMIPSGIGLINTRVPQKYMITRHVAADKADFEVSAKLSAPPVHLPPLTKREKMALARGERIQKQNREGRSGYGIVVVDIEAPAEEVFDTLTRFDDYGKMIPTVRDVQVYSSAPKRVVAQFAVSRFSLRFNVVHTIIRDQRLIKFQLDDTRTNMVMKRANGFWHVQDPPDRPGFSRVWLSAEVVASMLVPTMIVDYAANRALPRATRWLQPYFLNEQPEF